MRLRSFLRHIATQRQNAEGAEVTQRVAKDGRELYLRKSPWNDDGF